ncbi:3-isopropylmalate dehydrogenase [Calocera viscosa TUFC12733]|uniref:3-isopropylmalate dehydrogenase n=1 Tax=Calocera viscosa (strain TUFC12733) TaxID=1330018 RepID=A0A167PAT5_CALVF|nr:3-isopropylmalate dehydrogenase [Calocera viscosa TUFC12733]
MSNVKKIVLLPGDGIGIEVVAEAKRVLDVIIQYLPQFKFEVTEEPFGGAGIEFNGQPLPDSTVEACKKAHCVLMGAVGHPKYGLAPIRPDVAMLAIRKAVDAYANIRPVLFPSPSLLDKSPLKTEIAKGTEIILLRELVGGIYFGEHVEANYDDADPAAWDVNKYSRSQVERIARFAGELAIKTNPPTPVHSLDKANVLASSRLWRVVVTDIFEKEYPQVPLDHTYVDAAAMILAARPKKLNGIVVCDNQIGDILSDELAVVPGSIGVLPSAALSGPPDAKGETFGLYEPIHGSAPDIMGKGIANPIGTILSLALMFRYSLALEPVAKIIEAAVSKALDYKSAGGLEAFTADLGGSFKTKDVGDAVISCITPLLKELKL